MNDMNAAALPKAGLASYENRTVAILALTGGVAGLDMLAVTFLMPFIASDLHLNNAQVGAVVALQIISWSFGAMIVSVMSDFYGKRRVFLVGAMVCFALFSAGSALASSFAWLLTARLLTGISEGPVIPMQNTIMISASSPHRRGLNMGIAQNFGAQLIGSILGPVLLVWIATHLGGWRHAFLIAGLPALVMAAVIQFGIREPAIHIAGAARIPVMRTIREISRIRNIRLCFVICTFASAWYASILTFMPLWVIRVLHLSPASMSIVLSMIGVAGMLASVLVPALSDRIGRRPAVTIFALVGIGVPLGLLFVPANLGAVCAVVLGGGMFLGIFPLFIGVVPMESVDPRYSAMALGLVMGPSQILGGFIGPLGGGIMSDKFSLAAPLIMACGFAFLCAVVSLFLEETAPRKIGVV